MLNFEGLSSFYKNKKVLVTGHTGFKGSWLCCMLLALGAEIIGYALDPQNEEDNFNLCQIKDKIIDIRRDIRDKDFLHKTFQDYAPQIVFHLAAQPLVIESYKNPAETYDINVMGTINLLDIVKQCDSHIVCVIVTTDKCYENKEQIWGYRETDSLGGYDPYSASKACVELVTASYRNSFMHPDDYCLHKKAVATVRAGNVLGGGDWSPNRIIPDCVRALKHDIPIEIRNPASHRPWQHVMEPLYGYIMLACLLDENPSEYGGAWNFGPNISNINTVGEIVERFIEKWGNGSVFYSNLSNSVHESDLLALDSTKSIKKIGWRPKIEIDETLALTAEWYLNYETEGAFAICNKQILNYFNL